MIRIIGSGSNGIGYYMYHGGITPSFDGKFYNEEVNGIPRKSYDFQAPIGQYGQIRTHFKSLRMLHMFLESYGSQLAPMKTVLPETNKGITPEDTVTLRYAVRSTGDEGFVFFVNFQDHHEISDIRDVRIEVKGKQDTFTFPVDGTINIPEAMSGILPFNLDLENVILKSATVQPLTILETGDQKVYIFSSLDGIKPELLFPSKSSVSDILNAELVRDANGDRISGSYSKPFSFTVNGIRILVLTQELAENSEKIGEHLFISNSLLTEREGSIEILGHEVSSYLHIYPALVQDPVPDHAKLEHVNPILKGFISYRLNITPANPVIRVEKVTESKYLLSLESDISNVNDVFIKIDYIGDRGMAFINGELIVDDFYYTRTWDISLRKTGFDEAGEQMLLSFHPMYPEYEYLKYLPGKYDFREGKILKINGFEIIPEYKSVLTVTKE